LFHLKLEEFAQTILLELEAWAHDLGYSFSVLELIQTKGSIVYIKKTGYAIVENYEPYVGLENSICMRKPTINEWLKIFFLLPIGPKMISHVKTDAWQKVSDAE
jgi:hypothetical protein